MKFIYTIIGLYSVFQGILLLLYNPRYYPKKTIYDHELASYSMPLGIVFIIVGVIFLFPYIKGKYK